MPLPSSVARMPLHQRTIVCNGFRRDDGLFDVEARIVDTKGYPVDNRWRGTLEPGAPIHDMWLRLTLDDDLVVIQAEASTDAAPFAICGDVVGAFHQLAGLRIGPGFRRSVQSKLGGVHGCTHLVELLGPLATTAMQTILPLRVRTGPPPTKPPGHLDGCHALRRDGPVVREHYPDWFTGAE